MWFWALACDFYLLGFVVVDSYVVAVLELENYVVRIGVF